MNPQEKVIPQGEQKRRTRLRRTARITHLVLGAMSIAISCLIFFYFDNLLSKVIAGIFLLAGIIEVIDSFVAPFQKKEKQGKKSH